MREVSAQEAHISSSISCLLVDSNLTGTRVCRPRLFSAHAMNNKQTWIPVFDTKGEKTEAKVSKSEEDVRNLSESSVCWLVSMEDLTVAGVV